MTLAEFTDSVKAQEPPQDMPQTLKALWHDRKGDWRQAHEIAQDVSSEEGAWVHAYLHRKEGDLSNAGYWYRQARRPASRADLDREWEEIAQHLLAGEGLN